MQNHQNHFAQVARIGDVLVVLSQAGRKVLTDFYDRQQEFFLREGMQVNLIQFFDERTRQSGDRGAVHYQGGFLLNTCPRRAVFLDQLADGQLIEVLPDFAAVRCSITRPLPVLIQARAIELELAAA